MSDDITTGEIGRRLDALATSVATGMGELRTAVEARPDWKDVQRVEDGIMAQVKSVKDTLTAEAAALAARVAKSEAWGSWIGRVILGALAVSALGSIIPK